MRLKYLILIATIILISCEEKISEFQSENFIKFFGSGSESKGNCVIAADENEGSYLFVGYDKSNGVNKVYAVKTNKYGNTIWENTYQLDDNNSIQEGKIIKKVGEDFIIVATTQLNTNDKINPLIIKIDRYGDTLWTKEIDRNYTLLINDIIFADNSYYLVGETYQNNSLIPDYVTIKMNDSRQIYYEKYLPNNNPTNTSFDLFKRVFSAGDGNIITFGNSDDYISSDYKQVVISVLNGSMGTPNGGAYYLDCSDDQILKDVLKVDNSYIILINEGNSTKVMKVDNSFSKVWETTEPINSFTGNSITLQSDGSYFVCGSSSGDISFIRISSDGTYAGEAGFRTYPGVANSLISTADGGLLILGATASTYGTMVQLIKTDKDLYLLKP